MSTEIEKFNLKILLLEAQLTEATTDLQRLDLNRKMGGLKKGLENMRRKAAGQISPADNKHADLQALLWVNELGYRPDFPENNKLIPFHFPAEFTAHDTPTNVGNSAEAFPVSSRVDLEDKKATYRKYFAGALQKLVA